MHLPHPSLPPPFAAVSRGLVPSDAQCAAWMAQAGMEPHIQTHSRLVADMATALARMAREAGLEVDVQAVRASALLHDLAKSYTIRHGGNHCQIGGAWVQDLTGNPAIAQGVIHHVHWPGPLNVRDHFLVLAVIYADKRIKHESVVTLTVRFEDLMVRYGTDEHRRALLLKALEQARSIERALELVLGADLDACTLDRGRLVQRA